MIHPAWGDWSPVITAPGSIASYLTSNDVFSAGMYFAVVKSDTDILQTEKIRFF